MVLVYVVVIVDMVECGNGVIIGVIMIEVGVR